jgi:hypothetical protein
VGWMVIVEARIWEIQDKKKGPQRGLQTCDRRWRKGLTLLPIPAAE